MARSGQQKLTDLVNGLQERGALKRNAYPIVLVAGFASFGEPIFGTINYWGGFEDLASALQESTGAPVILTRTGPFSTNWERACEVYCQLRKIQAAGPGSGFDTSPAQQTRIPIQYGQYIPLPPRPQNYTKQAVVLGNLPSDWVWNAKHPVHMICHSQGGNTVRLLSELLSGRHGPQNPAYFGANLGNRQEWIRGVVTLGTPFLGTTITSVIFDEILRDVQVDEVISRLVVSASLNPSRFVDLQLDHWGFRPQACESFLDLHRRLKGNINAWWASDNNAVKDNGIQGIARLNRDFAPQPSDKTYYFTMSFDATRPIPTQHVSPLAQDLKNFPLHPLLSLGGLLYPGPFDLAAKFASGFVSLTHRVPGAPSVLAYAKWAAGFANNLLAALGYQIRVPIPGSRIPLADMLPVLTIFSVGMSGKGESVGFSAKNDGIVDTASMRGPALGTVDEIDNFNMASIQANRGVYWHLGLTEGVDHADEVGVFTDTATYDTVRKMYEQLGDLLSAL